MALAAASEAEPAGKDTRRTVSCCTHSVPTVAGHGVQRTETDSCSLSWVGGELTRSYSGSRAPGYRLYLDHDVSRRVGQLSQSSSPARSPYHSENISPRAPAMRMSSTGSRASENDYFQSKYFDAESSSMGSISAIIGASHWSKDSAEPIKIHFAPNVAQKHATVT
ncbi:hypothetical protein M8818_005335 [Zalaria obscura]|uniref:Uncharacterized protein n=1 Tax=Zalaria obscura TaxID=2024903 RepID=A0ACC3S9A0_9PEZI